MRNLFLTMFCVSLLASLTTSLPADDWPMLGRGISRNPVSLEKNPPIYGLVHCFDATSGKQHWTYDTQRAPTIDGDRVYAVSQLGELACLRLKDGVELWRRDYVAEFGGQRPMFGYADCPIADGNASFAHPEVWTIASWRWTVTPGSRFGNARCPTAVALRTAVV